MLFFGHIGITVGAALLINRIYEQTHKPLSTNRTPLAGELASVGSKASLESPLPFSGKSQLASLREFMDLRLIIIGSLLPDIIDKPVGMVFFQSTFDNGRIFTHTLAVFLALLLIGLYLFRSRKQVWLLNLVFGFFFHLVLDMMWQTPQTLLWPLYGWTFPKEEFRSVWDWFASMGSGLLNNPFDYLSELAGLLIILGVAASLTARRQIRVFLKQGEF